MIRLLRFGLIYAGGILRQKKLTQMEITFQYRPQFFLNRSVIPMGLLALREQREP